MLDVLDGLINSPSTDSTRRFRRKLQNAFDGFYRNYWTHSENTSTDSLFCKILKRLCKNLRMNLWTDCVLLFRWIRIYWMDSAKIQEHISHYFWIDSEELLIDSPISLDGLFKNHLMDSTWNYERTLQATILLKSLNGFCKNLWTHFGKKKINELCKKKKSLLNLSTESEK